MTTRLRTGYLTTSQENTDPFPRELTSQQSRRARAASLAPRPLTGVELEVVLDFAGGQVELDGVVGLDGGVRVPDGAPVVSQQGRDALGADLQRLDAAQLVLRCRRERSEMSNSTHGDG